MSSLIQIALSQYGIKEIVGKNVDNPRVIEYLKSVGANPRQLHDETAWCSAFVNWVCIKANKPFSGKLTARSWLDVGQPINPSTNPAKMGDIIILWRESKSSWKGHVGFYIRDSKNWIYILGGNQNNQVKIQAYPKGKFLGLRRV